MRRVIRISLQHFSGLALLLAAALAAGLLALVQMMVQPNPAEAAFPGENGKIAFVRSWQIFTMKPDGSRQIQLTNSRYINSDPSWSPNGKLIAFERWSGSGRTSEIYTMRADGSDKKRLTKNSVGDYEPTWSPDGTKIAFTRCTETSCDLYTMDRNGSNKSLIHSGLDWLDSDDPSWSPDGTKIAFTNSSGLFVVNADGSGEPSMLVSPDEVDNPEYGLYGADWSPDGQWIVFGTDDGLYSWARLYKVKFDGMELTQLPGLSIVDLSPAWSPDGRKIVFSSDYKTGDYPYSLYKMNADGTGIREFASEQKGEGDQPSWQPLP